MQNITPNVSSTITKLCTRKSFGLLISIRVNHLVLCTYVHLYLIKTIRFSFYNFFFFIASEGGGRFTGFARVKKKNRHFLLY